jgi:hypothetical protein
MLRSCTVASPAGKQSRPRALASIVGACLLLAVAASPGWAASGSDWPTYLHDLGSSDFTGENLITPGNASTLRLASGWPVKGGGTISTQPVVANNLVYWGSWDGYEHATPLPGSTGTGWARNLGQTSASGCPPATAGVASTGAVASVTLAGQTTPRSVLFVGGGGNNAAGGGYAQLDALDALTGSVLWHTPLGISPSNFMWSSPAVYRYTNSSGATVTNVYVGVASFGDCPIVQGQVVQLDATSGQVQNTFDVVPSGCTGGAVWGSPTIDQSDGSLYVATGNAGSCSSAEPHAVALLKLRASDLSLLDSWQLPGVEQIADGDFGSAPTLFSGTVKSTGSLRFLVGVPNKNGIYYVFDRSQLSAGPVARLQLAVGGNCPQCGKGGISPSAWDGATLYVAGGNTTINGTSYKGSVRAWNPNNLSAPLWQRGLADGPVLGAVAAAPGLVAVGEGSYTEVLDASNGNVLLRAPVKSIGSASPAIFYGPPSIAHGALFEGDTDGDLYAYAPTPPPTVSAPSSRLYARATMGLTATPVRTSWSATDPSGIASYSLERQVNGGSWSLVGLPATTTTSIAQPLSFGSTYRYRVRATDRVANTSTWAYGATFKPLLTQQSSSAVAYSGTWTTAFNTYASGGSLKYATRSGASATYSFTGASVSWVAYSGPDRGSAAIYIDGLNKGTVNLYSAIYWARQIVFADNWTSNGSHTIRIVCLGTPGHPRVGVDAVVREYRS